MNKKLLASAVLSVLSFGAMADSPSFDNVEIGYANFDFDGIPKLTGYEFKGSKSISDNFYIAADYSSVSDSGFDLDLTTFGIGYKNAFSNRSTFFTELDYASIEADGGLDDNGYELTFGVRTMMTTNLELKAAVEYLDFGDNDDTTSWVFGAAYNISESMAVYADYKYESEVDRLGVGVRMSF